MPQGEDVLIVTIGGDVYVKSAKTRRRFRAVLTSNLTQAAHRRGARLEFERLDAGRTVVRSEDLDGVAELAARTFGVHRVERAVPVGFEDLEDLSRLVAERARERVEDRTFAVRVRRRGDHGWRSVDAERIIGDALIGRSAGVDLDDPEVTISVIVVEDVAWVVQEVWDGPGGLPLGTQSRCLSLLSGGFDSPVAAWMLLRRGSPLDFVHFQLDCAQADHATAVAHTLWRRWGSGTSPLVWVVDFENVQDALRASVPARLRQVVLKQLMFAAADRLAASHDIPALVTGEALGQVSSQTLHHLAEIDRMCERTVLRPLTGFDKQEIISRARAIGTEELSARAKEVCDLSAGQRVAVAAKRPTLVRAREELPARLVDVALSHLRVIALEHWVPGSSPVPVVAEAPDGVPLVAQEDSAPTEGPFAVSGDGAAHRAYRLASTGRDVVAVVPPADTEKSSLSAAAGAADERNVVGGVSRS